MIIQSLLNEPDTGTSEEYVTGMGISLYQGDNEHPVVFVEIMKNLIWINAFPFPGITVSFEDFLKLGSSLLQEMEKEGDRLDHWHKKFKKKAKEFNKKNGI